MLSDDDLAQYRKQGWIRLGEIAPQDQVANLAAEERRFRLDRGYGAEHNDTLRVNIQLCHRSEIIRQLCTTGPHIEALRSLIGPNVCLTHQQFVTKLPDKGEQRSDIPLHQDQGYGQLEPMTDVTIWLPLVDTDAINGALCVVTGSHEAGLLDHDSASINPVLRETECGGAELIELRAGEAVAFSGLLIHGSGPNRGPDARPAMYMRYCTPHTTMASEGNIPVLESAHSWMVAGEA